MRRLLCSFIIIGILVGGCSSTTAIPENWKSYNNESLGLRFQYPPAYIVVSDETATSEIKIESPDMRISMMANPQVELTVESLINGLSNQPEFDESHRISVEKGQWIGTRIEGKITPEGSPGLFQVLFVVKAPSESIFTLVAVSEDENVEFTEVDLVWDSLEISRDSFPVPPALQQESQLITLEPEGQNYSLRYPDTWVSQGEKNLTFASDPEDPLLFLMSIHTLDSVANIDEGIKKALDNLNNWKDVVLESEEPISVSGANEAVMLVGTAKFDDDTAAVFRILVALSTDNTHIVEVIVDASKWGAISAVFDAVFDSFNIFKLPN